jgi:hypothetical protein
MGRGLWLDSMYTRTRVYEISLARRLWICDLDCDNMDRLQSIRPDSSTECYKYYLYPITIAL